jgi:LysM repeat protein
MRVKNILYLLVFNIFASATISLAVLYFWEESQLNRNSSPTPIIIYVPITGTPPTMAVEMAALFTEGEPTRPPATTTPTAFIMRTELYFVQPGDSLGTIAQQYEVSIAAILSVNELDDPDTLYVGQRLNIPVGPLPTSTPFIPTATITPSPTSTPRLSPTPSRTPTRTPNQDEPEVAIESVMGAGDFSVERVKISHISGRDSTLQGWQLQDEAGNRYIFPHLTLRPGGFVYLHTRSGSNTVTDLFWGLAGSVWQSGETAVLVDASGQEVSRFVIP